MADLLSIITCLWPWCAPHIRYQCEVQENVRILSVAMDELKEMRNNVKRKVDEAEADPIEPKKRTNGVDGWLKRVENIEGEVEKLLEKANELQISRGSRCLGGCCPPSNKCWSNYKLGKSIAKKLPLVDELKGKGHFEEVTYNLPPPPVQDMNLESTVGMESMFDKVWRLITSTATDDKVVRIMGLYGQGGVGKTTLLEKINNEFKKICGEQDHVVIFVVVSKPINYEAIQTQIGKRLKLSLQEDERGRANEIFNVFRNKNFVILLDDIWERVDLRRIGIPILPQGNSKLIFTTRSESVCGEMKADKKFKVECLPWEEAWRLFQENVGEETLYSHPGISELAELVAKECGGLPLALITIGRAMSARKSSQEWKDALRTLRNSAPEFPGMSDKVLPRLKFSYDNLPNETIKSCFLYCALYPEDRSIYILDLIEYWIGEGFLSGFDNSDETRNHGHAVVETLKRACLLESCEYGGKLVKMHDVIRDLALWIVNDCKSSSSSSKTTDKFLVASNVCERWRNAQRIFWMAPAVGSNTEFENPPTSNNLQTLIVGCQESKYYHRTPNFCLPQSFFQFMPFLRVLVLSCIELTELPTSICEVHKLQYLNLKSTKIKELPTSICELHELQYLNLSLTEIKELPVELRKLVKLKFLDLMGTHTLSKIPAGVIANLSKLQVLKLNSSGFKDWELKEGLSFRELKKLQEVGITINTYLALEKLLCNQKLQKICTRLTLERCVHLKSISFPPLSSSTIISEGLGNLASLKLLTIEHCWELEELTLSINEDGETNNRWWYNNKLEILFLRRLPRLNNIVWGEKYHHHMAAAQQDYPPHYVSPFQNLHQITIYGCGALKDLTWLVYMENLEELDVSTCEGLEKIIELGDEDGGLEEAGGGGDQMLNTGGRGGAFRRLKTLEINDLPKLKSICRHALAFPSIHIIGIFECPELKKLPLNSGSNVNNTLEWIEGSKEWWDELQWEDETIKSKFLPYHYPKETVYEDSEDSDDFEDPENSDDFEDSSRKRKRKDFEDPENSGNFEDWALLRGHDESSFVIDVDLTFRIGIDGGPSDKRKKKQLGRRGMVVAPRHSIVQSDPENSGE